MTTKTEHLLRAIAACIQADGKLDEREIAIFEAVLERINVEDKVLARSWLDEPQTLNPQQLRLQFRDRGERAKVLHTVVSVALADGKLQLDEVTFLGSLLAAMDMSYQELDAINPETL